MAKLSANEFDSAPMKLGEVLDVAIQCARALSAAHADRYCPS